MLERDSSSRRSKKLYESIDEKPGKLPDSAEIFPAHGQGPVCGKEMISKPGSTIGFVEMNNPVLNIGRDALEKELSRSLPWRTKSLDLCCQSWGHSGTYENTESKRPEDAS